MYMLSLDEDFIIRCKLCASKQVILTINSDTEPGVLTCKCISCDSKHTLLLPNITIDSSKEYLQMEKSMCKEMRKVKDPPVRSEHFKEIKEAINKIYEQRRKEN